MYNRREQKHEEIVMSLGKKEEEIRELYREQEKYKSYKEIEEERINSAKKIINVFFTIIIIVLLMITIDVLAVYYYNKGPFFAIPLYTHNDGGTKEYFGIGYKVIKYNQTKGRIGKEVGLWSLKYNTFPIETKDLDLVIEFTGDETNAYQKYFKQYIKVSSTIKKVDKKNRIITVGYQDEDKVYSLDIICKLVKKQELTNIKKGKEISIVGTVTDFKIKTENNNSRLYISNCFIES